jgi:hypothetical protein
MNHPRHIRLLASCLDAPKKPRRRRGWWLGFPPEVWHFWFALVTLLAFLSFFSGAL